MSTLIERYEHVECRKSEGAHYTPKELANFVAEKIAEKILINKLNENKYIIADPAIGDGELIIGLLDTLQKKGIKNIQLWGFDINKGLLDFCYSRISTTYPDIELNLIHGDFLGYALSSNISESNSDIPKFDCVIANPPYIRTQVMGSELSQKLSKDFGLKGRVDIYQAFLIAVSYMMKDSGIAGFIVSNRFMTTKGCGGLRKILLDIYDIHSIWDFGDTKLFEAAVLPAVMIFSKKSSIEISINKETSFCSIYESNVKEINVLEHPAGPIEAIKKSGVVRCQNGKTYLVKQGILSSDGSDSDIWRLQDEDSFAWLENVKTKTWCTFSHVGKIRVGVKTTRDSIFIKDDWLAEAGCEPELLKPLITHQVASRFKRNNEKLKSILYTHVTLKGKKQAVDINHYPISKKYLESHRKELSDRDYVKKANRNWFEIWVPQDPDLWQEDKVVFRDICEEPTFWLDREGDVVNGDCYWMIVDNSDMPHDILWLILAVANSKFIESFYDYKFNNKLYSNKRRFMSQYVENFPLPDPSTDLSKEMIKLAMKIYYSDGRDSLLLQNKLDQLVWEAFGLNIKQDKSNY